MKIIKTNEIKLQLNNKIQNINKDKLYTEILLSQMIENINGCHVWLKSRLNHVSFRYPETT